MNKIISRSLAALLVLVLCLGMVSGIHIEADSASYVANWGIREEVATELSSAAKKFYTGSNTFAVFSKMQGGSGTSGVTSSPLYDALQEFMDSKQHWITSYNDTRSLYRYTDCQNGDTSVISSFYSGKSIGPAWDSGATWNREHTWPNSKGEGNSENDIMMLRPTSISENSSRGNKAYGEKSGFYDPNEQSGGKYDLRGDVCRIALYVYVRWGGSTNQSHLWGSGGVIQDLDLMLRWMQEDPVDTWELGRNDAVQSITGTRNVFVDYPELAFLLFGQAVPSTMVTPSGEASNGVSGGGSQGGNEGGNQGGTTTPPAQCAHTETEIRGEVEPTCTKTGYSGDIHCSRCGVKLEAGKTLPAAHKLEKVEAAEATCSQPGNIEHYICTGCDNLYADEGAEKILGEAEVELLAPHDLVQTPQKDSTCTEAGLLGHYSCNVCKLIFADENAQQQLTEAELVIPAGHKLEFVSALAPTVDAEGHIAHYRCTLCRKRFSDEAGTNRLLDNQIRIAKLDKPQVAGDDSNTMLVLAGGLAVVVLAGIGAAVAIIKRRNKAED